MRDKGGWVTQCYQAEQQTATADSGTDSLVYVYERIDAPHLDELDADGFEKAKNRVYFTCADYEQMDENQQFYLHKSVDDLKVNQSAQNPITYLLRPDED